MGHRHGLSGAPRDSPQAVGSPHRAPAAPRPRETQAGNSFHLACRPIHPHYPRRCVGTLVPTEGHHSPPSPTAPPSHRGPEQCQRRRTAGPHGDDGIAPSHAATAPPPPHRPRCANKVQLQSSQIDTIAPPASVRSPWVSDRAEMTQKQRYQEALPWGGTEG